MNCIRGSNTCPPHILRKMIRIVPGEGIEPSWDCSHWFLRPDCIPFQHPGAGLLYLIFALLYRLLPRGEVAVRVAAAAVKHPAFFGSARNNISFFAGWAFHSNRSAFGGK